MKKIYCHTPPFIYCNNNGTEKETIKGSKKVTIEQERNREFPWSKARQY
jgi:hypothetical protein